MFTVENTRLDKHGHRHFRTCRKTEQRKWFLRSGKFLKKQRYSSAQRLSLEDINFEEKTIVMAGVNHKSRRRHLLEGMPDNVWPWLLKFRYEPNVWALSSKAYLYRKMHAFQRAEVPNPGNILRHSFCSYHVALHRDAAKTAVLMQHTKPATLYRHYKGMARQADGERYFKILP
jgi:hypothetical protein